jgi:hypothetical protein
MIFRFSASPLFRASPAITVISLSLDVIERAVNALLLLRLIPKQIYVPSVGSTIWAIVVNFGTAPAQRLW